jgi:hypothetical protein
VKTWRSCWVEGLRASIAREHLPNNISLSFTHSLHKIYSRNTEDVIKRQDDLNPSVTSLCPPPPLYSRAIYFWLPPYDCKFQLKEGSTATSGRDSVATSSAESYLLQISLHIPACTRASLFVTNTLNTTTTGMTQTAPHSHFIDPSFKSRKCKSTPKEIFHNSIL